MEESVKDESSIPIYFPVSGWLVAASLLSRSKALESLQQQETHDYEVSPRKMLSFLSFFFCSLLGESRAQQEHPTDCWQLVLGVQQTSISCK